MCHRIWKKFLVATHNVSETNRMHSQHPPRVSKHLSVPTHRGDLCGMLSLSLSRSLMLSGLLQARELREEKRMWNAACSFMRIDLLLKV